VNEPDLIRRDGPLSFLADEPPLLPCAPARKCASPVCWGCRRPDLIVKYRTSLGHAMELCGVASET
jgi:hypothetical protein